MSFFSPFSGTELESVVSIPGSDASVETRNESKRVYDELDWRKVICLLANMDLSTLMLKGEAQPAIGVGCVVSCLSLARSSFSMRRIVRSSTLANAFCPSFSMRRMVRSSILASAFSNVAVWKSPP